MKSKIAPLFIPSLKYDLDKILCDDNMIIVFDEWIQEDQIFKDYYIVHRPGGIRYRDVIDTLAEAGFDRRTNTNHKFLERIIDMGERKNNSVKLFGLGWGS